jgi:hypothetical protein
MVVSGGTRGWLWVATTNPRKIRNYLYTLGGFIKLQMYIWDLTNQKQRVV